MDSNWEEVIHHESTQPYFGRLQQFLQEERQHHRVYPPVQHILAALTLTPLASTNIVILGQDPYHGDGQANGLAFSVNDNVAVPPSLRNIFRELRADLNVAPTHGSNLSAWAQQGILLLNTTLTVRDSKPASHRGKGWETFTDQIIRTVNEKTDPVVFVLWGAHAQSKESLIAQSLHLILKAPHPSPLSAHRGFFGSKPFSQINDFLTSHGKPIIHW